MRKLFFDRLVGLKDEALDFIALEAAPNGVSGGIDVNINPDENFVVTRIEFDSGGLFINLNGNPTDIRNISREKVIMIASFLDGSWNGL